MRDIVGRIREGMEVYCDASPRLAAILDDAAKEVEKLRDWHRIAESDLNAAQARESRLRRERDESRRDVSASARNVERLYRINGELACEVDRLRGRLEQIAVQASEYRGTKR